jgi:hypothetical protein
MTLDQTDPNADCAPSSQLPDSSVATTILSKVPVMDDIAKLSLTDLYLQCHQHELGPQMCLHRQADDPACGRIERDGEIQEPRRSRDIRNLANPELLERSAAQLRSTKSGAGRRMAIAPW